VRYDDPRGRRDEHGSLSSSLPTESNVTLHLKNSEWWSRKMLDAILFTKSGVNVLTQISYCIFKLYSNFCKICCSTIFFKRFYLFERESAQIGGVAEREADSSLSREPDAGLFPGPWDHDHDLRRLTTEPPRHPDPQYF